MVLVAATTGALDLLVQRACRLYTLPAVALEVLELTSDPTVDAAKLKQCIERDPALTGKILKTVNSSMFGLGRKVSDLNQALGLLGVKPLKMLVLGFSLPPQLSSEIEAEALEHYWRHTLVKAVAARLLAERTAEIAGDDAFLAALLQDIGVLVLLKELGREFADFFRRVVAERADLLDLEMATLGFEHRALSAKLLESWGLQTPLVQSIVALSDSEESAKLPANFRDLPRVLKVAERLAMLLADDRRDQLAWLEQALARESLALAEVVGPLEQKVAELAETFDVPLAAPQSYDALLAAAHGQLRDLADEAAEILLAHRAAAEWPQQQKLQSAVSAFIATAQLPAAETSHETTTRDAGARPALNSSASAPQDVPAAASGFGGVKLPRGVAAAPHASLLDLEPVPPSLEVCVAAAVTNCRRSRQPLSLMLVALDQFENHIFTRGLERTTQLMAALERHAERVSEAGHKAITTGDGRFALVLCGSERGGAVEMARLLCESIRRWSAAHAAGSGSSVSISAGVATVSMPAANFPASDLIDAAEHCLYAAQAAGGHSVKSIDIY